MTFEGVYLDHNSTSPIKPEVRDSMLEIMDFPGNASSVHKAGRFARQRIEAVRGQIADFLNVGLQSVIVFTSSATEANNQVLRGSGCERVIVSAVEHKSVLAAVPDADVIPVLPSGVIDLVALENMLIGNLKQTLISVMFANNETGVLQPISEVVALAKKYGALVHTDAVQAVGRVSIDIKLLGVDYLTFCAHKMGGPQGVGCLVMSNCVAVEPLILGGGQEKNMRAGTYNLAGIVGMGKAIELAARDMPYFQTLSKLRDTLEDKIEKNITGVKFYGKSSHRLPNTSMFSVENIPAETLLIALDLAGVYVSSGSACTSGTVAPSHVLLAMGATLAEAGGVIRISLGWNTTENDLNIFLAHLGDIVTRMRKSREG